VSIFFCGLEFARSALQHARLDGAGMGEETAADATDMAGATIRGAVRSRARISAQRPEVDGKRRRDHGLQLRAAITRRASRREKR